MDSRDPERQRADPEQPLGDSPSRHDVLLGSIPLLYLCLVAGSVLSDVPFVVALGIASVLALFVICYALFLRPPRRADVEA